MRWSAHVMMRPRSCRASLRCWPMARRFSWKRPGKAGRWRLLSKALTTEVAKVQEGAGSSYAVGRPRFQLSTKGCLARCRENGVNRGSRCGRFDIQAAAQEPQSFAHSANSYTESSFQNCRVFGRESSSRVCDVQAKPAILRLDANACGLAAGVAMDVGQAFLDQAEDGQFGVLRQSFRTGGDLQIDVDPAALRKAVDIPAKGGIQSHLIEQRGVQQMG